MMMTDQPLVVTDLDELMSVATGVYEDAENVRAATAAREEARRIDEFQGQLHAVLHYIPRPALTAPELRLAPSLVLRPGSADGASAWYRGLRACFVCLRCGAEIWTRRISNRVDLGQVLSLPAEALCPACKEIEAQHRPGLVDGLPSIGEPPPTCSPAERTFLTAFYGLVAFWQAEAQ